MLTYEQLNEWKRGFPEKWVNKQLLKANQVSQMLSPAIMVNTGVIYTFVIVAWSVFVCH